MGMLFFEKKSMRKFKNCFFNIDMKRKATDFDDPSRSNYSLAKREKPDQVAVFKQSIFHSIMCIDNSGSMRNENRSRVSFQCAKDYVRDQIATNPQARQMYSLISFNTRARVHFQNLEMNAELVDRISEEQVKTVPQCGTNFSCAFQAVAQIVEDVECWSQSLNPPNKVHCVAIAL